MRQLFFCKTIITDSFKPYGRNRNGLHVFKEMTENKENKAYKILNIILTVGTILLAAAIIILHITLIFDRVVWGDEAFSANIIRGTNYAGIFERVYYLENHPPLYYYVLRIFADLFGYKIPVYHLVSVLCFTGAAALALTGIRKKLGALPVAFFLVFAGLSSTCSEYVQEIRMYELCFFLLTVCVFCTMHILTDYRKKWPWIVYVICGVLASYSHYYALVTAGILLFITSLAVFIREKGKTWLYGVVSIVSFLLLYGPWISVMIRQMGYVKGSWWMDTPESLDKVLLYVFGNDYTKFVFIPLFCLFFILAVLIELGIIKHRGENPAKIAFGKPSFNHISDKGRMMTVLFASAALVVIFAYVICAVYKPILAVRYMYNIIPLLLGSFMVSLKIILDYVRPMGKVGIVGLAVIILSGFVLLGATLLDFKYYRSVSKTEAFMTEQTLGIIGTPGENTVFTSLGVQHLSWTVLQYYYPDSEVYNLNPAAITDPYDEMWAFMADFLSDEEIEEMDKRGYDMVVYPETRLGKYVSHLYHFVKRPE